MALIPILGIPSSYRYPASFAQINFGQGPSTSSGPGRDICIVAPKLSGSGTYTAATRYQVKREQDVIDGAGAGSPLHRAVRALLTSNKRAALWVVPYLPSSGGGVASATLDVVFATNASGTGVALVTVCGEPCSAAYHSGDTPTIVAAAIRAAVNAKPWLPVTALGAAGTVALTAKVAGASQGDGTIGQYQVRAEVTPGTGITVTPSTGEIGGTVAGADGATTEAANLLAALNAIANVRHYYIGITLANSTGVGHLKTHLAAKAEPNPGMRSVGVTAYMHTLAGVQAIAVATNYERIRLGWQMDGDADVATLTGNLLAVFHARETVDWAASFDLYREPGKWNIPAAADPADWPDMDDCNDAINDGVIPIRSDAAGSYIVMSVTTRSKDAGGTNDDFRASESHRVSVCDAYVDQLLVRDAATFLNKKLVDDRRLANGNVDPAWIARVPSNAVTPYTFKKWVEGEIDAFSDGGRQYFQNIDEMKASLRVVRDPSNTGRIEASHEIRTVDIRHQATFDISEVSPG